MKVVRILEKQRNKRQTLGKVKNSELEYSENNQREKKRTKGEVKQQRIDSERRRTKTENK